MVGPHGFIARAFFPSLVLGSLLLVIGAASVTVTAQNNFAIPQGSLIIAMDNYRQGNDTAASSGTTGASCAGSPEFNIRAYGYAVRLLHQSVKLRWIINNTKTSNTANDIAGISVTQLPTGTYGGQTCTQGLSASANFQGGPLVITPEYAETAKSLLVSYNSTSVNNDVRVYEVNSSNFTVPNGYVTEITHKPFVAVGPDCTVSSQCLSNSVYERLYAAAGLAVNTHYVPVANNTFQNYCVTLAAQAHAQSDAANHLTAFSNHVSSGGNLMLQCLSADIYDETILAPNVRYFTSGGLTNTVYADDPPANLPSLEPAAASYSNPFSQFVGDLGRANGYTEYQGNYLASTLTIARSAAGNARRVAMTRDTLPAAPGGQIFGLGGHEYGGYSGDSVDNPGGSGPIVRGGELARVNGSRMALNALLVPAKPACALVAPSIQGYKTVKLGTALGDDAGTPGIVNVQDTVEWTVRYINTGAVNIFNFQIKDTINAALQYQPASVSASKQLTSASVPTAVDTNAGFNGVGNVDTLGANVTLEAGAMITVTFKTKVLLALEIPNQATAAGSNAATPVPTDSADMNTPGSTSGYLIAGDCANSPNCYNQSIWVLGNPDDWTGAIEPTYIAAPTLTTAGDAEVTGSVVDARGRGIGREQVILQNASTGELLSVVTNSFGNFRFVEVPVGEFYIITIHSKRNTYEVPSYTFSLEDNLVGIQFVASRGASRGIDSIPAPKSVQVDDASPVEQPVVKTAPVVSAPVQRRTIVVRPAKNRELKDEEKSGDN